MKQGRWPGKGCPAGTCPRLIPPSGPLGGEEQGVLHNFPSALGGCLGWRWGELQDCSLSAPSGDEVQKLATSTEAARWEPRTAGPVS